MYYCWLQYIALSYRYLSRTYPLKGFPASRSTLLALRLEGVVPNRLAAKAATVRSRVSAGRFFDLQVTICIAVRKAEGRLEANSEQLTAYGIAVRAAGPCMVCLSGNRREATKSRRTFQLALTLTAFSLYGFGFGARSCHRAQSTEHSHGV